MENGRPATNRVGEPASPVTVTVGGGMGVVPGGHGGNGAWPAAPPAHSAPPATTTASVSPIPTSHDRIGTSLSGPVRHAPQRDGQDGVSATPRPGRHAKPTPGLESGPLLYESIWIIFFAAVNTLKPCLAAKMPARTPIPADVAQALGASRTGQVPYSPFASSFPG
jgi:hypothetical protein